MAYTVAALCKSEEISCVALDRAERSIIMKKYCTKCGHEFEAIGREVICPSCKAQAAEETKRAAVERAKRASWTGESVPVRISGRASTVIREFGKSHTMPFAESLDVLLRTSDFFKGMGIKWEDVTPYKSHRRDKHTTQDASQDVKQDAPQASKPQGKAQDAQEVKQAAKASKSATASKAKAGKTAASKSSSKSSKASKSVSTK